MEYDVLIKEGNNVCYAYGGEPKSEGNLCFESLASLRSFTRDTHPPPVILGGG